MLIHACVQLPATMQNAAAGARTMTLLQELQARIMMKSRLPGVPFLRAASPFENEASPRLACGEPSAKRDSSAKQDSCEYA